MRYRVFSFFIFCSLFSLTLFSENDKEVEKENVKQDKLGLENKKTKTNTEEKKELDDEFYSIQSRSLTACNGDFWFLEEYDEYGRITLSVLYEKDKLIEKKEYSYKDGIKSGLNIYLEDKLIKIKYNKSSYELERAVYDKDGKELKETKKNEYDKDNLLLKTSLIKDDAEYVSIFTYNNKAKKKTRTDFVNNEKVCFIEFKKIKKIVHLFQFGKEIRVLEEEY